MLQFLDNKKDRTIALVVTFLIFYYITLTYRKSIITLMLKVSPFQLTYLHISVEYGMLIATVFMLSTVSMIVYFLKKKNIIGGLKIGIIGIVVSLVILLGYFIHCRSIVNRLNDTEPNAIVIWPPEQEDEEGVSGIVIDKKANEWNEILQLVHSLEPVSKSIQKDLIQKDRGKKEVDSRRIEIDYFNKDKDDLEFTIIIDEIGIYIQNGYSDTERTFCKDNGIRRLIETLE